MPLFRFCYCVGNQGLMTEMDAVKIPHSDDRLQLRSTKIFDVAKNFHISRLLVWPNGNAEVSIASRQPTQEGAIKGRANYDSSDLNFCLACAASGDCAYFSTTSCRINRALTFSPSSANAKPCFRRAAGTLSACGYLLRTASNSRIA